MIRNFTRSVFFLFAFLLLGFTSRAQSSYDFASSSGTFTPLAGATAIDAIEDDDVLSAAIPIGFTFNYFGTAYTDLKVSSNGNIQLNSTASSSIYDNSFSWGYTNLIAPLWDDLDGLGGTASYLLSGTAGSRVLTIEWLNWQWNLTATAGISFQVKLYETTGRIEFIYRQETGALVSPSASIGILGNTYSAFYSIANTSASPVLSPTGASTLNQKPATGQVYSFTPGAATVAPTVQASSVSIPSPGTTSMNISWTNGNGSYRAVFVKQTPSSTETVSVLNGNSYPASTVFGDLSSYASSNWYCVYNGTGNSVTVTGLESYYPYRVQVLEYNGLATNQKYNITTNANNPANVITLLGAPVDPTSTLTLLRTSSTEVGIDVSEGNGTGRAVFIKAGNSGTAPVVDNTTYLPNTTFGSGSSVSGWSCVFNGPSSSAFTVKGLSPGTDYIAYVVDYNGPPGSERYHVSSGTGNPVVFTTFPTGLPSTYTFTAEASAFGAITGGTDLNTIETDDALSANIPIGFTFRYGGLTFTQLKASSNGYVTFDPYADKFSATDQRDNNLASSQLRPVIAALWDDLNGTGGEVKYITNGVAPNRLFIIQYLNFKWNYSASTAGISFQIRLFESSNKIEFVYRPEAGAISSASASIGLSLFNQHDGTGVPEFYSLNNFTASAVVSSTSETTSINTKPVSGQKYSFSPVKLSQTITFGALDPKVYAGAAFSLSATASSSLPVTYTSSNTAVAFVTGSTVNIVGAGTTTITANQAGNGDYLAAPAATQDLVVNKANQTITFNPIGEQKFRVTSLYLGVNSSVSLPITYTSSNTAVATVSGNQVTFVGLGTTTITANQSGNANYAAAASIDQTFTVVKGDQTIDFPALPIISLKAGTYTMKATASSNLPVTYVSANPEVISISGNVATILKAASSSLITVSQAGNEFFNAAQSLSRTFYVKTPQVLYFPVIPEKSLGDPDFYLPSQNTYTSSNTAVATITGNLVKIVGKGTTNITGSNSYVDIFYEPAEDVTQTLVVKSAQTITFGALENKTIVDQPFTLTATSSAGLPITFTSSDLNVATVNGSTVTIVGIGTTTITAIQTGDAEFGTTQAVQDLKITKGKPVITFEPVSAKTYGDASVMLSATSTSSSPITYSSSSAVAFLRGNEAVLSRPGLASVRAYQESNATYEYGSADLTFCVNPAKPKIRAENFNGTIVLYSDNGWGGNQWLKDGVEISGATTTSLTVTEIGAYTTYSKVDGCAGAKSDPQNIVVTALEDVSSLITVSPNPSQKEIRIDLTSLGKEVIANITINDLAGRTVHSSKGTGVVFIDIASYEKGNYIIGIKSGNRVVTKQLAKN